MYLITIEEYYRLGNSSTCNSRFESILMMPLYFTEKGCKKLYLFIE